MSTLPDLIQKALDDTGLPYAIERSKKHRKIKLAGRLVGVIEGGKEPANVNRARLNVVAQIRRAAAQIKEGK